jgi:hypothetical protein
MGSEFIVRLPVVLSVVHDEARGGDGRQARPTPCRRRRDSTIIWSSRSSPPPWRSCWSRLLYGKPSKRCAATAHRGLPGHGRRGGPLRPCTRLRPMSHTSSTGSSHPSRPATSAGSTPLTADSKDSAHDRPHQAEEDDPRTPWRSSMTRRRRISADGHQPG